MTPYTKKLFITGLIFLLVAIGGDLFTKFLWPEFKLERAVKNIQEKILLRENQAHKISEDLGSKKLNELITSFENYLHLAENNGLIVYVFRGDNLFLWSDNRTVPEYKGRHNSFTTIELDNGLYLQLTDHINDLDFVYLLPIKSHYQIENNYLSNGLVINSDRDYLRLSTEHNETASIYSATGNFLFSLKLKDNLPTIYWPLILYFFSFLILIVTLENYIKSQLRRGEKRKALSAFFIPLLIFIIDWKFIRLPGLFFGHKFFSADLYASSDFLSSLGDLTIYVLLLTWIISFFIKYTRYSNIPRQFNSTLAAMVYFSISILFGYHILMIFQGLVLNSNINLDIRNIFSLSLYSILSFFLLYLLVYNLIRLSNWFFHLAKPHLISIRKLVLIFLVPSLLASLLLFQLNQFYLVLIIFILCLWSLFVLYPGKKIMFINGITMLVIISSFFGAYYLIKFQQINEHEFRIHLASNITSERDNVTEFLFNDLASKIKQDKYIVNYFFNPLYSKSILERRIRELYFTGYLNKYDVNVYTYARNALPLKGNYLVPLDYFQKTISRHGILVDRGNFFHISSNGDNAKYLGVFEFIHFNQKIGTLVLELRPKTFYKESIYPALLLDKPNMHETIPEDYSYAVYLRNRLINQQGKYPYETVSPLKNIEVPYFFYEDKDHSHLFFKVSDEKFCIVSKEKTGLIYPFAAFSFLFIFFFVLSIFNVWLIPRIFNNRIDLKKLWYKITHGQSSTFKNLLFRHKIQVFILGIVFFGLAIFGVSTFLYLKQNYNNDLKERLHEQLNLISNNIEQEIDKNPSFLFGDKENLQAWINPLSNIYQLDINIYNLNGRLITSSQPQIFELDILEKLMNPTAFTKLRIDLKSKLINEERIGKLDFLSAYAPLRNSKNQIVAFLQLPYFAKETELKSEISSLFVTLINLYVFLFLVVILISVLVSNTLTAPLELIKEKLRNMQLGAPNEPIKYKGNDEIGMLVREYNHMVKELEKSTEALTRSEREGAWREMARQVAHEIKNPLTPMKLNIQRLQKEWANGKADIDKTFKRVTEILINQIEQLSLIATEFSAFAKMPAGKPEKIDVNDIISNTSFMYESVETTKIILELNQHPLYVKIDSDHLSRILNNLINNAVQAIPEEKDGRVVIKTYNELNNVIIEITDNGCGITPDKQEKIFMPNFSTKSSGMGLGLALVKRMVEGASGKIWFKSIFQEGTTFYLSLPIYEGE